MHDPGTLLKILRGGTHRIFLQAHNFPDHDAVAASFALRDLLRREGIDARIIYEGEIERNSLRTMIEKLGIDIQPAANFDLRPEDYIVVVDGCKGNKNVTDLIGEEVAVIDHHEVVSPEDVRYVDIRTHYGSTCTIIYTYFRNLRREISRSVATAMLIGLNMDTALMTRGVSPADLQAYADLYVAADTTLVNSILRNQVQTRDLAFYRQALDAVRVNQSFAFCYFPDGCNQNLLGMLGDFFLTLQEVDFVALCAHNGRRINFSLRSERNEWNCSDVIQQVLDGIGFGGGHAELAGGMMPDVTLFNKSEIESRFRSALGLSAPV
ncbi:MAG: DHH family phosphoesterase [Leptospiraceae bacterium]|nr:DHH family phosphoesterase [Leptospiraceae bacterium]